MKISRILNQIRKIKYLFWPPKMSIRKIHSRKSFKFGDSGKSISAKFFKDWRNANISVLSYAMSFELVLLKTIGMPTAIWWLPNRHEWLSKESWSRGTYSVFGPICPLILPMLCPSLMSHWTKWTRVACNQLTN